MIDRLWQDLRFAIRLLRHNRLFTLTAVLSLAVGIAGNATIFSLADAMLLRPTPGIAEPTRVAGVGRTERGSGFDTISYPNYLDLLARNAVFEGLVAYRVGDPFGLGTGSDAVSVAAGQVSGNFFSVLRVPMAAGRGFLPSEERANDPSLVAVLGHRLWTRHFGSDPTVVGRTIRLNGRTFTVVGVTAAGFQGVSVVAEDLWVPLTAAPEDNDVSRLTGREVAWLQSVGRLKPGVTLAQARSEMLRLGQDLEREYPQANRDRGLTVAGTGLLPPEILSLVTGFVGVLFALVGLILLIACANVGGMLLARGSNRAREMAVRLALGAERVRILRLLVTESALLAFGGCVLGIVGASAAIGLIRRLIPVLPVTIAADFRLDWRVVVFSGGTALAVALITGIAPALHAARTSVMLSMRSDVSATVRRFGLRQAFVLAQVAMSVLLLVCALLLGRSLRSATGIDPGFQVAGVDLIGIELQLGGYDAATGPRFAEELVARVARIPGVQAVGSSRVPPLMMQGYSKSALWAAGAAGDSRAMLGSDWNLVTPGYFSALLLPIVRGRAFVDSDRPGAPEVAVVNETLARRLWPNEEPIGKTVMYASQRDQYAPLRIVGVARDAKYRTLGETPRPFLYVPLAQHYHPEMYLMVRTNGPSVAGALRSLVRELDPNLPLTMVSTLSDAAAFSLVPNRLAAWVAGAVGLIGILLAALGIYGITAYHVSRRTREIGIRVALGALRSHVLFAMLRQSATVAAVGAVLGLGAAAAATQLLGTLLYGVTPLDTASFVGGAALFAMLAVVASLVPARRALAVNPGEALRAE